MAEEQFQERTEEPTQKRREDVRKKGQVARSAELSSAVLLFACFLGLYFLSAWIYSQLAGVSISHFRNLASIQINLGNIQNYFADWLWALGRVLAPLLLVLIVVGVLVNVAQVGVVFSGEPLVPKLNRIGFTAGFSRLFSKKSLFNLAKDSIKVLIIGYIAYVTIDSELKNFVTLSDQDIRQTLILAGKITFKVGLRTALALLVLAVLDYAFQRWEFEKGLKMTRQEIKEEYRELEGDPLIKARVKRVQREMSKKRMLKEVPKADVVVTNPTEIAVALKYDSEKMFAPKVIVKGERLIAQKIKEIATKHNIPIVENKPLAQTLFKTVEIGMEIPANLYKAVAEVLAYVYKLKGKMK
jgi:flagellar biosynthetic protein FlhB